MFTAHLANASNKWENSTYKQCWLRWPKLLLLRSFLLPRLSPLTVPENTWRFSPKMNLHESAGGGGGWGEDSWEDRKLCLTAGLMIACSLPVLKNCYLDRNWTRRTIDTHGVSIARFSKTDKNYCMWHIQYRPCLSEVQLELGIFTTLHWTDNPDLQETGAVERMRPSKSLRERFSRFLGQPQVPKVEVESLRLLEGKG